MKKPRTAILILFITAMTFSASFSAQAQTSLNQEETSALQAKIEEIKNAISTLQYHLKAQAVSHQPTTSFNCAQIKVEWNPVPNAEYYKLYRNGVEIYKGKEASFTDTGLAKGRSYNYSIRAGNHVGESSMSQAKTYTAQELCPPASPAGFSAQTGGCGEKINISWNPALGASGYELFRGNTLVYKGSETFFTDSGLKSNRNYSYRLKAVGQTGQVTEVKEKVSAKASDVCSPSTPGFQSPSFPEAGYASIKLENSPGNSNTFKLDTKNRSIIRFSVKALDSDITIQTINIFFDKKPWQYFERIILRSGFATIADIEPSNDDFHKVSNDEYRLRISGVNMEIKENKTKTFTLRVDARSSIPNSTPQSLNVFLNNKSIRVKDAGGAVEFFPYSGGGKGGDFSRTFTISGS